MLPVRVAAKLLFFPIGVTATKVRLGSLEDSQLQVGDDLLACVAVASSLVHVTRLPLSLRSCNKTLLVNIQTPQLTLTAVMFDKLRHI